MATVAIERASARTFYRRMAAGLGAFIVFGFLQFELRGMVDIRQMPVLFHIHGALMMAWLGLFVIQANLPTRGAAALHKSLGWTSVVMVPAIAGVAIVTCVTAMRAGIFPPFFTKPFYLGLVVSDALVFAALVGWAVAWRNRADWHRRLMLGSLAILMEPALGRLLPAPLIGATTTEWIAMAIQLLVPAAMIRHDRKALGAVHPGTLAVAVAIIFCHLLVAGLPMLAPWQALTARLVGT